MKDAIPSEPGGREGSHIDLEKKVEMLTRELAEAKRHLAEALEQQTATAEVLRVISSSPGGLEVVFSAMLENALRICEAKFGMLQRYRDGVFVAEVMVGAPPALVEAMLHKRFTPTPGEPLGIMWQTKKPVHTLDAAAAESKPPSAILGGARSHVVVPMLKDDGLIGAIAIYRQEVRPFTEKQIELLTSFATQAVIAIENTRLLNELRRRTGDLTEALEHQTATSEVLNVITRSPTDAQPVFDAIAKSATHLCEAMFSGVFLYDGDLLRLAAGHNFTPEVLNRLFQTYPKRPDRSLLSGRAVLDRRIAHVPDLLADAEYSHQLALAGNWRAGLAVPMLRDGKPLGVISVARAEAVPFSERQIQLLTTFADQAVIAIANVRLFDDLQARTRDLSESLQQQTATSDVLKVISRSTFDLQMVLDTLTPAEGRCLLLRDELRLPAGFVRGLPQERAP